jgi:enoyl-CoA hydratase/carnithine racemase
VSISLFVEGPLARVTLSHSGKFNAMSRAMWRELKSVFDRLSVRGSLRCVILAGEAGHFCAGGDISEYPAFRFDAAALRGFHEDEVWAALQAVLDCPVPVVAQIEGNCMGAGMELASCCDIRVAGEGARFGAPIARLGFPMAPREAQLVAREAGIAVARAMLLEAAVFSAAEMQQRGFLNTVVTDAALAPQAARMNKHLLSSLQQEGSLSDALLAVAYRYAPSAEHREGVAAFLAKRPPVF